MSCRPAIFLRFAISLFCLAFSWDCALDSNPELCDELTNYVVIIDAGSTGSRIFVFHYQPREMELQDFPYVMKPPMSLPRPLGSYKTKPGMSSFATNLTGLTVYLADLVSHAQEMLLVFDPLVSVKHVPLYLGATAGMRELPEARSDFVMHELRRYFKSKDCPFSFSRNEQARVISGEEEGVFGWLAVNYALDSISSDPDVSYGVLDMGGASAQIAFVPQEPSILANFFPMHVGRFATGPVHLYTHSYLGFGYVKAFQRLCGELRLLSRNKTAFDNPCLSKGTIWHVDPPAYGVSIRHAVLDKTNGKITMRGTGDFLKCREVAKALLLREPCFVQPCAILGEYQPDVSGSKFSAIGEYSAAYGITEAGAHWRVPVLQGIRNGGIEFCKLPELSSQKLLSCWIAAWTFTFLTDGLGFPVNTTSVQVTVDADWTQGQAIYESNFFPYRIVAPRKEIKELAASSLADGWHASSFQFVLAIFIASALSSGITWLATHSSRKSVCSQTCPQSQKPLLNA